MEIYTKLLPQYHKNLNQTIGPRPLSELEVIRILRNINPLAPSDKCLIAITEGYNYPLRLWASRLYEKNINITNKMIHTGFIVKKYGW